MEVVNVHGRGSLWRLWTYLTGVFMEVVNIPGRVLYGGCAHT